ncbi:MAG: hypothetical protein H6747_17075, partial [Deltaproteobacteria bacterium]|nr:hypothetical protein [Deltaproteobacteria bacterium]
MNPIRKNTAFTAMCLALAALLAPALASATPSNVLFEGALRSTTGGPA